MRTVLTLLFIVPFLSAAVFVLPALAESEEERTQKELDAGYEAHQKAKAEKAEQAREMARALNPHFDELESKAKEFSETLSKEEVESLVTVREAFGMIRSIRLVQDTVSRTVKLCGEENPDIKEEISGRYGEWSDNVGAAIEVQEKEMKGFISKKNFDEPKKIQSYLDLIDKAARHAEDQIETTPVTDMKSCRGLIKSMEKTEPKLVGLLNDIQWKEPEMIEADSEEGKK